MDCLFCKIARREFPAQIIHEDMHAVAFLDIDPRSAGHSVVIPKRHAETVLDLHGGDIGTVFSAVRATVALLKKALNPDGFTIGVNHGAAAGQAIPHLHVHVIPRHIGDKGGSMHTVVTNPPSETVEEIFNKIKGVGA